MRVINGGQHEVRALETPVLEVDCCRDYPKGQKNFLPFAFFPRIEFFFSGFEKVWRRFKKKDRKMEQMPCSKMFHLQKN